MNFKPRPLGDVYRIAIDSIERQEWYNVIGRFADANLYQAWDYESVRCSPTHLSHLLLMTNGRIVSAVQARIVRTPFHDWGVAYIRWGPLWQLRDQRLDPGLFRIMLRAIRNEYVCNRGMILRIFPVVCEEEGSAYADLLCQEGYTPAPHEERSRTLIMDIDQPLALIRQKMDQKWRNGLNKSERNGLELFQGSDDALFADFIALYQSLLRRKKFRPPNNIDEFRAMQQILPVQWKMRIILCRDQGINTAGVICAAGGNTGIYLFGATNEQGMRNKGSYLLQWKAIEWLKMRECTAYNLNGINPQKNPGSYHFKAGLAGKSGKDVFYLGRFDCYPGHSSAALVRAYSLFSSRGH